MIEYLTPLAGKSSYTIWDAAMIPIREGLEALLVVGALLALVKKSNEAKGKAWIWSGVLAGLVLSAILALFVKFVFTSGAFGQNNFLISGWTGIVAAVMLLYMSYWLHSKSNIAEWNQYIRNKSQSALDTGRMVSLGIISFLAVFREGTETVLFIIGMVNQISFQKLIIGILVGFGILAVFAYLMLVIGVKLPMKPFFQVSSLIVFYLCFKFTGLGIHSFQLAGFLPSTTFQNLPSIDFLGFYPSWQSAIPQMALLLFALAALMWNRIKNKENRFRKLYKTKVLGGINSMKIVNTIAAFALASTLALAGCSSANQSASSDSTTTDKATNQSNNTQSSSKEQTNATNVKAGVSKMLTTAEELKQAINAGDEEKVKETGPKLEEIWKTFEDGVKPRYPELYEKLENL